MKRSIGEASFALGSFGGTGSRTGWNDQKLRCSSVTWKPSEVCVSGAGGQTAPSRIHAAMSLICSSLSLPCGGILKRS